MRGFNFKKRQKERKHLVLEPSDSVKGKDVVMRDLNQANVRIPRKKTQSRATRNLWALLASFGVNIDPHRARNAIRGIPHFIFDLREFRRAALVSGGGASIRSLHPVVSDRFDAAAQIDRHYFYQDVWAARRVFAFSPDHHLDVGSRLDGFIAHVLAFSPVTVIDIRPEPVSLSNLSFLQDDATDLRSIDDNSIQSLSSLHAAEHFGLGRYGDPIDPAAHLKFMASLARVLQPGGRLLFSVPTGIERVYFNAHRVLSTETVLNAFSELTLVSFSAITDEGEFLEDCETSILDGASYGCGLYEFTK